MRQGLRRWLHRRFRLRWLRWVWMCRMRPGLVGSLRRRVCCRSRLLHVLGGVPLLLMLYRARHILTRSLGIGIALGTLAVFCYGAIKLSRSREAFEGRNVKA
jgi:hypothetical protein